MAKITDPSKLLQSAKSTAIVRVGKPNIIAKTSTLSKSLLATRQPKDIININNKLVKVDKFLKSDLIVSQKKSEVKRKDKEKQDFAEAEKKLETPKTKGLKLPGISLPSLGFMDRVKRFIFFTALGWALPKILEFLPKLQGFSNIIGGVYNFAEGLFGKLFDGFMSLVKFGGDLKDKTLGFIATAKAGVGGNYQKEFDKLEKQFNTFVNASIIAGVLAADIGGAAIDEYNKWRKKNEGGAVQPGSKLAGRLAGRRLTPQELKDLKVKPGSTEARAIQKPGTQAERLAAKQQRRIEGAQLRAKLKEPKPKVSWWQKLTGGIKGKFGKVAGKLAGPFSKFAGAAIPGLGAAIGFADAKARSASGDKLGAFLAGLSASLDAFTAAVALAGLGAAATGVGLPGAAVLGVAAAAAGTISLSIDVILLIRDILKAFGVPVFSKGGRIVRRYQGGGNTRGGRQVGAPKRRAITPATRRLKQTKPPKSQPGKDVGGENKIKRLYPNTGKRFITEQEWRDSGSTLSYTAYLVQERQNEGKKPNPYKALTTTAKILKDIPLVGGIMGAAVDIVLGQKPDANVYRTLSAGIGSLVENLANQKTNQSVSSLMRNIKGFAEGGNVPASRELKGDYRSLSSGDMIAKVLGPTIDQRVNEAIQNIQNELQKKKEGASGQPDGSPGPDDTPGARLRDGSNAQIEADLLEYYTALYGKNAAIGIVANLRRESGYRTATPDNSSYEGMSQWSRNDRWPKFVKWAENKGLDPYDRNAQAQYIAVELKQLGTDKRIVKAKTPEEAASIFYNEFERGAYSKPVKGNSYNPDNPHENKNKAFVQDISGRNPDIGKRTSQVVVSPPASPSITPTKGAIGTILPQGNPQFSSGFKWRWGKQHRGHDYGVDANSPVLSAQDGKVVDIYRNFGGHGDAVVVEHSDGTRNVYGHVDSKVNIGDSVKKGQTIATVKYWPNANGYKDNTHLHFERIEKGKHVDPSTYVSSLQPPKQQARKPGQQPPQPQPPQASNANSINASGLALTNLQERIKNLKPGQKIIFNNVGSIQSGKNWLGQSEVKFYNTKGENIGRDKFNELLINSEVLKQMKSNNLKVQNMQRGGIIPKKPNRPIPNSFASYETYGSGMMIAIQPMIIEKPVPVSTRSKMIIFPVPVAVNSNMDNLSFSRG